MLLFSHARLGGKTVKATSFPSTIPISTMKQPSHRWKILHVETGKHMYGGALQVLYLLNGLARRDCANVLVSPRDSGIAAAARQAGHRVCEVDLHGELDLNFVQQVREVIRRERPDVVHLHSRRGGDLLGGLAARMEGVPTVLSRRVDTPESRWLAAMKYRLYDRVIAISHCIEGKLLAAGVPAAKVRCVHSGVDVKKFAPGGDRAALRRELGLDDATLVLGTVAQLIRRKGHLVLLESLAQIVKVFPNVRMLFFGQGPLEQRIRQQIEWLNLSEHVRLMGFREDLPRVLQCLDMVVHPAAMEGLGVALLQAAAAGVPIVASRAGGIPEVVRNCENGLLVPAGDSAALTTAICRLLADSDLRREYGAKGRALVEREFSMEQMAEQNLAVYSELLSAPRTWRAA